jgi:hypothetical protein
MKKFLFALLKDLIDQAWTLLGLAVGWVLLEGSARSLVGNLIGITLLIWIITFPTRYDKGDDDK